MRKDVSTQPLDLRRLILPAMNRPRDSRYGIRLEKGLRDHNLYVLLCLHDLN